VNCDLCHSQGVIFAHWTCPYQHSLLTVGRQFTNIRAHLGVQMDKLKTKEPKKKQ